MIPGRTELINIKSVWARFKPITFKKRILFIFLFSSLMPFICLGFLSFYTINSIIGNKVESAIQHRLKQDLLTLENTLNNLNHVSQQLAIGGRITTLIERLQQTDQPYERVQLYGEIRAN